MINRRRFLRSAAAAPLLASGIGAAADAGRDWPERPVRIVCSYVTGGSSDIVARIVAQYLTPKLGKPFIIDNRPGAGGAVSAEIVKHAAPDGYTLICTSLAPFAIAPTQFKNLAYDPIKDFTHASYIGSEPTAFFVSPALGVSTLAEFIALAKAEPTKIRYGSSGVGSAAHINGEYLKKLAGIQMLHVPYKGAAPMIQDYKAGNINAYITSLVLNMPFVEAGEVRVIGSLGRSRVTGAKDVRTFREQGYDIVSENWFGFSAPAGLSPAIARKIDAAVKEVVATPAVQDRFYKLGVTSTPQMTTAEFARFISDQVASWRPRVIAAGAVES